MAFFEQLFQSTLNLTRKSSFLLIRAKLESSWMFIFGIKKNFFFLLILNLTLWHKIKKIETFQAENVSKRADDSDVGAPGRTLPGAVGQCTFPGNKSGSFSRS